MTSASHDTILGGPADTRRRASAMSPISLRDPDAWGIRRRVLVIVLALSLASVVAVWPTIDAYGRSLALVSDAVLRLPIRPLTWVTADPTTEHLTWPQGGTGVLTLPGGSGPHPGIVLGLGAEPAEPDDPRVSRLTESLARIGFAVLLVRAGPLIDGKVTADEIPLLVGAFTALRDDRRIHPERVGFVGLSVAGSTNLVAAADPRIADDVRFVLALGPYFDAGALTTAVVSATFRTPDGTRAWEPDDTAVRVVRRTLLTLLPPSEQAALEAGTEAQTADGRTARVLLERPSLQEAESAVASLTPALRAQLDSISPSAHLGGLRAPLYLLHDRNDPFIPWPESDAIAAAYRPAVYHRLDMFEHVEPEVGNAGVLLRDGWRLLRVFATIIEDAR